MEYGNGNRNGVRNGIGKHDGNGNGNVVRNGIGKHDGNGNGIGGIGR